jgi:hypothetical protein
MGESCAGSELVDAIVWQGTTSFAPLDEVFGIRHGRGLVETRSICLADQVGGCCVAATLAAVNLYQKLEPF